MSQSVVDMALLKGAELVFCCYRTAVDLSIGTFIGSVVNQDWSERNRRPTVPS